MTRTTACILAALPALAFTTSARAERSFAEIFFISLDSTSDGAMRVDWVGSALIWLLILMSVASVAIIVLEWRRSQADNILPAAVARQVRTLIGEGRFTDALTVVQHSPSDFSRILHAALSAAPSGYEAMTRVAEQTADDLIMRRFRRIEVLNVLGQVSPMLGLFGTVYGVIVAFMTISSLGGSADSTALAGGIGTALVATFWGLLVAIPALCAYAMVRNRVDAASSEAIREVDAILARFRPVVEAPPSATESAPASALPSGSTT